MSNVGSDSPIVRQLLIVGGTLLFIALSAGYALSQIANNETEISDNSKAIEAIRKDMGEILTDQAVIKTEQKNEMENMERFRQDTSNTLDEILERLSQ